MGGLLTAVVAALAAGGEPAPVAPPREIPDDPPRAPAGPQRVTLPAVGRALGDRAWERGGPVRLLTQVNVTPDQLNILGDAANEPSIAVDPTAPNRIAIGWRQFDAVESNFREAGYGWSRDGGRTWRSGTIANGIFRSDPVLEMDRDGGFYYLSLRVVNSNYICDVWRSGDGGRTWGNARFAFGGDKSWFTLDRTGGQGDGHVYQSWSNCCGPYPDTTFARSNDRSEFWETPVVIPGPPRWGTITVGPQGEVYAAGGSPTIFVRSLTARDAASAVTFEAPVSINLGGSLGGQDGAGPNPGGLLGQIWVAADTGPGPRRGHIYVCGTVNPPGSDPADVYFIRSTNGGQTWSQPRRVNTDPANNGAYQWFGTMSVAPSGRIDVVWNDTRGSAQGPRRSRLYYSSSSDGGTTWTPETPLTEEWDSYLGWPNQSKIGDYYHMRSDDTGAHLAWAATFNGEQDVYYMRIGDYDCNANGVGDAQDLAAEPSLDCNANGVPDSCELAAGSAADANGDGRIDTCQCLADWNADGTPTSTDISAFLASWLSGVAEGSALGDHNADGTVDSTDISTFLTAWLAAVQNGC